MLPAPGCLARFAGHGIDDSDIKWEWSWSAPHLGRHAQPVYGMSTAATRLLHIHVPKTAGTALRTALQNTKDPALTIFPHYDERSFKAAQPDQFDVFSGHFGFDTATQIGGRMVTVLRDPVDRFVSVYYFWRTLYDQGVERNRKTALAVNYNLTEFAKIRDEQLLAEEFFNRATWQIAYGSSVQHRATLHDQGVTDSALLARACQNLGRFAAVGFQEDTGPFNAAIERLVGRPLGMKRVNVTKERLPVGEISAATRDLIENWVYLDRELMQHARRDLAGAAQTVGA